MRAGITTILAFTMMFASGVSASASNATEVITHSYVKRELSDASYNRLAIVHASGTYHFVGVGYLD